MVTLPLPVVALTGSRRGLSTAPSTRRAPVVLRTSLVRPGAGYHLATMWDAAVEIAAAVERALTALGEALAGVSPGWLVLGVALHLANQVFRGRGWFVIVRMAAPGEPLLRARDAVAAWVAGAGAGGVASARGGDAVRVLLLSRTTPRCGCPLLAGTLVAEGTGELAVGAALMAVAIAAGVGPQLGAPAAGGPVLAAIVAILVLAVAAMRVPRLRRLFAAAAAAARRSAARGPTRARSCPGSWPAARAASSRSAASSPPSACR